MTLFRTFAATIVEVNFRALGRSSDGTNKEKSGSDSVVLTKNCRSFYMPHALKKVVVLLYGSLMST